MSTTQLLLTLTGWYGAGFAGARIMVTRGHAPTPWIFAAWIAGALTLLVAAVWPWVRALVPSDPPPARTRDTETAPHR